MLRRLTRIFVKAGWWVTVLLCLLVLAELCRSYFYEDSIALGSAGVAWTAEGMLTWGRIDHPSRDFYVKSEPIHHHADNLRDFVYSIGPVDYVHEGWNFGIAHGEALGIPYQLVRVPLWFLSICLFIPSLFRIVAQIRRRGRNGDSVCLCPTCRYDLRAHNPGDKCPECGNVMP